MTVLIASDHAGYELKETVLRALSNEVDWKDLGPTNAERCDYPDYAAKVAEAVSRGNVERGVLICGSGIGMSIAANKFPRVRAAVVESAETARLSRAHNNANILCLGARLTPPDRAIEMIRIWLATPFEGARHEGRLNKILDLEKQNHG